MMKTFAKTLTVLMVLLLALSCSKEETLLPVADEPSDVLKGAKTGWIETPLELEGYSNYKATVPKTFTELDAGGPPCMGTLVHKEGHWYTLELLEGVPGIMERHVDMPLKITPGGVVKGYWPETWYDWYNPPDDGNPNSDIIPLITEHLGCDLHGPGINKGTIICNGTFDGDLLYFVFRFNGLDNGIPSTIPPDDEGNPPVWDQIDGPAVFEFSFFLEVID
jgi:hypothetical protein